MTDGHTKMTDYITLAAVAKIIMEKFIAKVMGFYSWMTTNI